MEKLTKKLLELDGVVGVGRGSVVVYVEDEKYANAVPKFLSVGGKKVRVKVMVVGKVRFCDMRRSVVRPIVGGISIGSNLIDNAGTLGFVDLDGRIVTCTHVVGFKNLEGDFTDDAEVLQPGKYDGGGDVIGSVEKISRWVWNSVDHPGKVDAALCSCEVSKYEMEVLSGRNTVYKLVGWGEAGVGDVVRKSGRTSGVTWHRVVDTNATLKVHLGNKFAVFKDVVIVTPPVLPGDSGSVFDKDGVAVGIGFAGSSRIGAYVKMCNVVEEIGVNIERVEGRSVERKKGSLAKGLLASMSLFGIAGGLYFAEGSFNRKPVL